MGRKSKFAHLKPYITSIIHNHNGNITSTNIYLTLCHEYPDIMLAIEYDTESSKKLAFQMYLSQTYARQKDSLKYNLLSNNNKQNIREGIEFNHIELANDQI